MKEELESDSESDTVDEMDTGELKLKQTYLNERLRRRFNEGELLEVMIVAGINPDDIPGETHNDKCLQLVLYVVRHGMWTKFINTLKELRPNQDWKV